MTTSRYVFFLLVPWFCITETNIAVPRSAVTTLPGPPLSVSPRPTALSSFRSTELRVTRLFSRARVRTPLPLRAVPLPRRQRRPSNLLLDICVELRCIGAFRLLLLNRLFFSLLDAWEAVILWFEKGKRKKLDAGGCLLATNPRHTPHTLDRSLGVDSVADSRFFFGLYSYSSILFWMS
mgnify:CR=1 FL=1